MLLAWCILVGVFFCLFLGACSGTCLFTPSVTSLSVSLSLCLSLVMCVCVIRVIRVIVCMLLVGKREFETVKEGKKEACD